MNIEKLTETELLLVLWYGEAMKSDHERMYVNDHYNHDWEVEYKWRNEYYRYEDLLVDFNFIELIELKLIQELGVIRKIQEPYAMFLDGGQVVQYFNLSGEMLMVGHGNERRECVIDAVRQHVNNKLNKKD